MTETPDAITLDTGAARLVVPGARGVAGGFFRGQERRAGFPRLRAGGCREPPPAEAASSARWWKMVHARRCTSGRPGGWRARRQGQARPRYPFTLQIHACAGASGFRIFHTFENDHIAQEMTPFQALELRFPGAVATTVVGERAHPLPAGARLFQQEDNRYVLTAPASGEGKHAAGWVNTAQGARIGVRHFREQYPKSIEAAPDATVIGLLPALPGPIYDGRPRGAEAVRPPARRALHLSPGLCKNARAVYRRGGRRACPDAPGRAAGPGRALRSGMPVAPCARWARWRRSGLAYNAITARNLEMLLERREAERELGLMHFGDWFGERTWNWGNLEYDLHHGLFLQFARTGDRRFFDQAVISARHQMDVDTIHHHREPRASASSGSTR